MTAAPDSGGGAVSGVPALDKYEILDEIGHGGMATVYRARDKRLGREVAVKVIHKHLRDNREVATRFVAEARAAAKLRHRNIVEVFDVSGDEDRERYLVVELCRGTTLRKILERHRDMPAEIGAAIVLELCDALAHAHEAGIIHRDVKPENVLVELPADRGKAAAPSARDEDDGGDHARAPSEGVVIKLTDFGIAKILDAQGVTSTGQVLGSPAHMAPEQIEGGDVDVRTDVFALGVLLYECLVGHLPFEGKNPAQVLRRVLDGAFMPADRERPTVGGRWAKIVAGALAREAADRTPSAGALARQIRDELRALGIDDARAEIDAFFADPSAYPDALAKRLVPRLVARGEAARKKRDIPGAAADYNRALALAPGDATILKRVSSLSSSVSRRALARRLGAIAGGSAVLGLVAFGVARWVRSRPALHETPVSSAEPHVDPELPSPPIVAEPVGPVATAEASAIPAVDATTHPRFKIRFPLPVASATAEPAAEAKTRPVKFVLIPGGAKLTVDGAPIDWFSQAPSLAVGAHSIQASVPGGKCCKPYSAKRTVEPPPADRPDQQQVITISLELVPATVAFAGAPDRASVSCNALALTMLAGTTRQVKLPEASWQGSCFFVDPDGQDHGSRQITLRAGETNTIAWPL